MRSAEAHPGGTGSPQDGPDVVQQAGRQAVHHVQRRHPEQVHLPPEPPPLCENEARLQYVKHDPAQEINVQ